MMLTAFTILLVIGVSLTILAFMRIVRHKTEDELNNQFGF